jgi:hypothetical protein
MQLASKQWFSGNIPFAAGATKMNVRVWSPHAGIPVRLKVEDKNDGTHSCETEATVTVASGWQTLEFNFANQATGTAALNLPLVIIKHLSSSILEQPVQ